ncbi:MAG TPA: hypothetical protein VMD59_18825, partial [Acidimicrobiales bacterium]|nr:hypothetical protein [Acidimicrobiales bacterium]
MPCQSGTPSLFVAEAASVKTFGQLFGRNVAVLFERSGTTWRADQAVIWSGPGGLPALCSGSAKVSTVVALVAPVSLPAVAAKVFTGAASGTEHGARATAPFSPGGIDQGTDSITASFTSARAAMERKHDGLSVSFTTTATPPLALPLAAGGDLVFVTLHQITTSTSKAGVKAKDDWPDGESVATPSPAVVHRQVDIYETVYA